MPRPALRFCIPFNENLETEGGWQPRNEAKTAFFSSRFHFASFRQIDQNPQTYYGEPVDTIVPKKGAKIATELGVKYTLQITDTYKTIENSLIESSILSGVSSELSAQLGVPNVASTGVKLATQIQTSLRTQFSKGFELSRSVVTTEEVSHTQTFAFDTAGPRDAEALICPTYWKVFFDLHLTHVDFLKVEYRRDYFGLRKKRKKEPAPDPTGRSLNVLKIMEPLLSIQVWQLNPSVAIKWRGEKFETVDDPFEIKLQGPILRATPAIDPPAKPSLYHLANAAFPTRWIKRKGPWTEDDLKQAELNESQNTAWFWQHGPGSDSLRAS